MTSHDHPFWDTVDAIRDRQPRYRREAYGFLMVALGRVMDALPPERRADPERRHLTGGELLTGVLETAREEFGLMAPTVFREWGLARGADVGAMVFELVERGQLSARPEDRIEDFYGIADLPAAVARGVELGIPRLRRGAAARQRPDDGSGPAL